VSSLRAMKNSAGIARLRRLLSSSTRCCCRYHCLFVVFLTPLLWFLVLLLVVESASWSVSALLLPTVPVSPPQASTRTTKRSLLAFPFSHNHRKLCKKVVPAVNPAVTQEKQRAATVGRRVLFASSSGSSPPTATTIAELRDELGLHDRFDRWRFLQRLLDVDDVDVDDANRVLYAVLEGYLLYPRPKFEDTDETGSPELTAELRERIVMLLDYDDDESSSKNRRIPVLISSRSSPPSDGEAGDDDDASSSLLSSDSTTTANAKVLQQLEMLLPDPDDDEDAHRGLWDHVIELHGREAVKQEEAAGSPAWKACCLVARVLVHYDFLVHGLVDSEFE